MKIRFVVEVSTTKECEECKGTSRAHPCEFSTYHLPNGETVELQAGDVYLEKHLPEYKCGWDNCEGHHLICMVGGRTSGGHAYLHHWNIDGRASNCTMKDDRIHRCWVRHGDPAVPGQLHVDKVGKTCAAGAGSIAVPGFHGYLHRGALEPTP